jgi:hypothetical protein
MSRIAGTLGLCWCPFSKDGITEVSAVAVAGESQPRKESCQGRATQDACYAPQGLAA